jgi:hypothetical protein
MSPYRHVHQQQHQAGQEHEVGDGAGLVDEHGVEHDARQEVQNAKQERRPRLILDRNIGPVRLAVKYEGKSLVKSVDSQ